MDENWTNNPEHDQLYELSCTLTERLQHEFGVKDLRIQCGYETRVGYHFRIHGVVAELFGRVSDRARDWLATTTPFRFEIQVDEM